MIYHSSDYDWKQIFTNKIGAVNGEVLTIDGVDYPFGKYKWIENGKVSYTVPAGTYPYKWDKTYLYIEYDGKYFRIDDDLWNCTVDGITIPETAFDSVYNLETIGTTSTYVKSSDWTTEPFNDFKNGRTRWVTGSTYVFTGSWATCKVGDTEYNTRERTFLSRYLEPDTIELGPNQPMLSVDVTDNPDITWCTVTAVTIDVVTAEEDTTDYRYYDVWEVEPDETNGKADNRLLSTHIRKKVNYRTEFKGVEIDGTRYVQFSGEDFYRQWDWEGYNVGQGTPAETVVSAWTNYIPQNVDRYTELGNFMYPVTTYSLWSLIYQTNTTTHSFVNRYTTYFDYNFVDSSYEIMTPKSGYAAIITNNPSPITIRSETPGGTWSNFSFNTVWSETSKIGNPDQNPPLLRSLPATRITSISSQKVGAAFNFNASIIQADGNSAKLGWNNDVLPSNIGPGMGTYYMDYDNMTVVVYNTNARPYYIAYNNSDNKVLWYTGYVYPSAEHYEYVNGGMKLIGFDELDDNKKDNMLSVTDLTDLKSTTIEAIRYTNRDGTSVYVTEDGQWNDLHGMTIVSEGESVTLDGVYGSTGTFAYKDDDLVPVFPSYGQVEVIKLDTFKPWFPRNEGYKFKGTTGNTALKWYPTFSKPVYTLTKTPVTIAYLEGYMPKYDLQYEWDEVSFDEMLLGSTAYIKPDAEVNGQELINGGAIVLEENSDYTQYYVHRYSWSRSLTSSTWVMLQVTSNEGTFRYEGNYVTSPIPDTSWYQYTEKNAFLTDSRNKKYIWLTNARISDNRNVQRSSGSVQEYGYTHHTGTVRITKEKE